MEFSALMRSNRLFIAVSLLLSLTLVVGLLGIAGLVLYRFLVGPTEVAMPPPVVTPTGVPMRPATATSTALPSATPTSVLPTPTLVIPAVAGTPPAEGLESGPAQDGPGMLSPSQQASEMPQTGLGPLETLAAGLILISFLGGARIVRGMWVDRRA